MKNIWKDLTGFNGLYQVSNTGLVKSMPREKCNKNGKFITKEKILKNVLGKNGYYVVTISKGGVNKIMYVHRLVAKLFLINVENKTEVNHINGIKTDNDVSNLEWCTPKENSIHSVVLGLRNPPHGVNHPHYGKTGSQNHTSKKVIQIDLSSGVAIRTYGGVSEASRLTGINRTNISAVCNGRRETGGGYKWVHG